MLELQIAKYPIALMMFAIVLLVILCTVTWALISSWFFSLKRKFQIDGIYESVCQTRSKLDGFYTQWSSYSYDLKRYGEEMKLAGKVMDFNCEINRLKERIAALEGKKKK